MRIKRTEEEGGGGGGRQGENHKAIGFLSNTGPKRLKKSQSYNTSIQCLGHHPLAI